MNVEAALVYLAVGSISKLVTLRYPTPGERIGTVAEIVGGAGFAGLLIPPGNNMAHFVVIPFIAVVIGEWLSRLIDYSRMKYDEANRGRENGAEYKRRATRGYGESQGDFVRDDRRA